jgi:hypothetical protein
VSVTLDANASVPIWARPVAFNTTFISTSSRVAWIVPRAIAVGFVLVTVAILYSPMI